MRLSLPRLLLPLTALLLTGAVAGGARAQSLIALDGTLPHGRTDDVTALQAGPDYLIDETLGWRAGGNLFHSFLAFDVATGESATFTADPMQPALANVIARVTGGSPSRIDGTLRSQIPGADFYFLNPDGVLFGGQSSLDVPASFAVGTAHDLAFADERSLDLLDPESPTLSTAAPEAFGFRPGGPRSEVVFSNPAGAFQVQEYAVSDGETLSVVGGDVTLDNRVRLRASQGVVQIAAIGDAAAEVPLDLAVPLASLGDPDQLGDVAVRERSEVLTTSSNRGLPQGRIVIRGGSLAVESGSVLRAGDAGTGRAIDVAVSGEALVTGSGTLVRAESPGSLPGGDLSIEADRIQISDGALVQTRVDDSQAGGALRLVAANEVEVSGGAEASSLSRRAGQGGEVHVEAPTVSVASGGRILSFAGGIAQAGVDRGGDIGVHADVLEMVDGVIGSEGSTAVAAGHVDLDVGALTLSGADARISSLDLRSLPPGGDPDALPASGAIRIGSEASPADSVSVEGGARISTQTQGDLAGGDIEVFADDFAIEGSGATAGGMEQPSSVEAATTASGAGGSIHFEGDSLFLGADTPGGLPGFLASVTAPGSSGDGGSVTIDAASVRLEGGAQISTTSEGSGDSGDVQVLADAVVLTGSVVLAGLRPSGVFSRSTSTGEGGDITIEAASIDVLDGASISSRGDGVVPGAGRAGDILLVASESIRVIGSLNPSQVTASGSSLAAAGNVTLVGPDVNGTPGFVPLVELLDGGSVDVATGGPNPGGQLLVQAENLVIEGATSSGIPLASGLSAEALGEGDAGGIVVRVLDTVRVGAGGEINSLTRGLGGAAGDIRVEARRILVSGGSGTAESTQGNAAAGNIRFEAGDAIEISGGASLLVRSAAGQDAGSISLLAPRVTIRDSSLEADSSGFGGEVRIQASDRAELKRTTIVALSRGVAGGSDPLPAGGNVFVEGGDVVLNRARIAADGFGNANGGNVLLSGDVVLVSTDTNVTFSSQLGQEGTFVVDSPYTEVTGDLTSLPENFLDASALLEEPCVARDAPSGSFAVRRVGELPPSPDAPLAQNGETDAGRATMGSECAP